MNSIYLLNFIKHNLLVSSVLNNITNICNYIIVSSIYFIILSVLYACYFLDATKICS